MKNKTGSYTEPNRTGSGAWFPERIPLKAALDATAAMSAILAFFMGRELINPLYCAGFLAIFAAALFIEWRGLPHPPRLLINLATLAFLGAIFTRMRRNYIVEALMEALLLMIAVKMMENKRPRDYVQIVLLDLAMVISYAMLSVEKAFIVYCFGMGLAATLALLLSTWLDREPDALIKTRELRQLCGRTGAIFCVMLPLCLLMFFGLPRTTTPLFGMRGQYGTSVTGFSDQVRLGDASELQRNNRLAFRAETESLGDARTPYWRGMVLDYFEGNAWLASRRPPSHRSYITPNPADPQVAQSIFLEPGNRGVLFALDQPLSVTGVPVYSNGDGVFRHNTRNTGRRLQYEAVSALSLSGHLRPGNPEIDRRRCLSLPEGFIPRLSALVTERTWGRSESEKIEAILNFLRPPDFSYTLEGLPTSQNALEQFLFVTRRGNCEYFASAMGVMLRMAGIPSRLVAGYRGGVYNDAGGYYMVQEQNAHVWVEAWDGAEGVWVRYDPTPAGADVTGGADDYNTFALYMDLFDYQWSKMVVNYSWEVQVELVQSLREILRNPRASLTPTRDGFRRFGSALSVPAAVLGVVTACGVLAWALRTWRGRRPEMELLRGFSRAMRRRGYARHESEGLSEFLSRVDDERLRLLALPFVRRFEEFYYRDRPADAATLEFLKKQIGKII